MNTFPPKPGTVAYRVIAFLEAKLPARPRATVGAIAGELRGVTPSQVRDALEAAHTAGYVNREYEAGPGGRGPVFYELVRNTLGELAVGGAEPRAQAAAALAEAADDGWLTGTGAPPHPGGVIEPVVPAEPRAPDPDPSAALVRHPGAFGSQPLTKVVQIRPAADGFAVQVERTPELADWLRASHGEPVADQSDPDVVDASFEPAPTSQQLDSPAPAVERVIPPGVQLDFAPGPDQFAVALAPDGRLHCWRGVVPYVFSRAEARALVDYLNRIDLEPLLEDAP